MEVKKPTTFNDQLKKIQSRGCIVNDEKGALKVLMEVNYYRFTAYFLPFKTGDGSYRSGTSFERVYNIYQFDHKLRLLLLSACEEIELMLRTRLSYYHAHTYGSLGYLDENNFKKRHNHDEFLKRINSSVKKNESQAFVKHHLSKYEGKFPIWTIVEIFSLGELSRFYSDMLVSDQKLIARELFHTTYHNTSAWLRCLTDLRNYCAHYSRLYYNIFPAIPTTPKGFHYQLGKRVFDYILVLKFLYPDQKRWNSDFVKRLSSLLDEYKDDIDFEHIGFPADWKALLSSDNPTLIR